MLDPGLRILADWRLGQLHSPQGVPLTEILGLICRERSSAEEHSSTAALEHEESRNMRIWFADQECSSGSMAVVGGGNMPQPTTPSHDFELHSCWCRDFQRRS
jgi:hypothetical protein